MSETKVFSDRLNVGIDGAKILAGSIPGSAFAPGAATPASNSITPAMLTASVAGNGLTGGNGSALSVVVDGTTLHIVGNTISILTVGPSQISASVAGNGLAGGAGSALSANVDNATLQIISNVISVGSITAANIPSNTITGVKLVNNTITNTQLANGTVRGSTSNTGTQQEVAQGSISTLDLRANAVSQVLEVHSALQNITGYSAVTSQTITTKGGTVLIRGFCAFAGLQSSNFGCSAAIWRGTGTPPLNQLANTASVTGTVNNGSASFNNLPLFGVDTPAAGTYTYTLYQQGANNTNLSLSSYSFTLTELTR